MPSRRKVGKIVLITGTSSGFGLLAAITLAKRGHWVFASMRNLAKADKLRVAAEAAGIKIDEKSPPLSLLQLDVTKPESVRGAVSHIVDRVHRIDVLVNNAGIGIGGFFEDVTEEDLRAVMETNFFGAVRAMWEVVPIMRKQRGGRIINVTSIGGRVPLPGMSAYSASKFALEAASESARYELAAFGVDVVVVEPGTFKTEIFTENQHIASKADQDHSPYRHVTEKMTESVNSRVQKFGGNPQRVADRILRVVESSSTRLRYTVGFDAKAESFIRWGVPSAVPDRLVKMFLRSLGLGQPRAD